MLRSSDKRGLHRRSNNTGAPPNNQRKGRKFSLASAKRHAVSTLKCTVNKLTNPVMEDTTSATPTAAKMIPTTPSATVSAAKRSLFQSPVHV
ncbi:hypothetical protein L1987_58177 [Smallanthus sonchifolius]|uniref:Uncharacterized protein n=1 Tax=Smallanthus sonchifolius TaxID=185202 RepID=A0ACB9DFN2_9ASTR|nr:hypothetical protein L1987_58177 [Smallanthus sonchifolius]